MTDANDMPFASNQSRTSRLARAFAVVGILAIPASAGVTTYISVLRHNDACENRHLIVDTFGLYTDVLSRATQRPDATPAEIEARAKALADLRADQSTTLAPLLKGC